MTASHCSGFMRMISVSRVMPALLTRISMVPHSSTAALMSLQDHASEVFYDSLIASLSTMAVISLQVGCTVS